MKNSRILLRQFSRPNTQVNVLLPSVILALASLVFWTSVHAVPKVSTRSAQSLKTVVVKFNEAFPNLNARFLGFADRRTALFVAEKRNKQNEGSIIRWDAFNSKIVGELPLSPWISVFNLRLSPDGRYLATTSNPSSLKFKIPKAYNFTILSSSNLKTVVTQNIKEDEYCSGVLFSPDRLNQVIVKMRERVPYEDTFIAGRGYLDIFDINSRKITHTIPYHPGFEADRIVPTADGKSWLMIYYSFFFNNFGEAGLEEEQDQGATIDVINPKTGKIEWHIPSAKNLTVGDPVIPFSRQEFVSSASIFNCVKRTSRPWAVSKLRLSPESPISEIPGKPQFVVLPTKTGFKIRNWIKGKDIKSWQVKGMAGRAFFSPDLRTIGYRQGQQMSFFTFDPTLLKP